MSALTLVAAGAVFLAAWSSLVHAERVTSRRVQPLGLLARLWVYGGTLAVIAGVVLAILAAGGER